MVKRALVVLSNAVLEDITRDLDIVICADSGLESALDGGLSVDLLVGDLDSISNDALIEAENKGIEIRQYPADKDLSDGEIALRAAMDLGATEIMMIGGRSGRMDHIAASLLMPYLFHDGVRIEVRTGEERFLPLCSGDHFIIQGKYGIVSLLPLSSQCRISTSGLKWDLEDESLVLGSTQGIHNEMVSEAPSITCHEGNVLLYLSKNES